MVCYHCLGKFKWAGTDFSKSATKPSELKDETTLEGYLIDIQAQDHFATLDLGK
jgi:hypothetical protein